MGWARRAAASSTGRGQEGAKRGRWQEGEGEAERTVCWARRTETNSSPTFQGETSSTALGDVQSGMLDIPDEKSRLVEERATLYLYPCSLESMKAHLALRESGFPAFDIQEVDMFQDVYEPSFVKMQPTCKVPVLKLPNGALYRDASEIVHYVHENYRPYDDFSADVNAEAVSAFCDLVALWDEENFSLGQPYATAREILIECSVVHRMRLDQIRRNTDMYGKSDAELASAYETEMKRLEAQNRSWEHKIQLALHSTKTLDRILNRAEELLANNQFLFGRNWTAADSMLVPVLHRVAECGQSRGITRRVNLSRYNVMVSGRPSFQETIAPYNYRWMRKHVYRRFLVHLVRQVLPYLLVLVVCLAILIYALHDNLLHLSLGGHVPYVQPSAVVNSTTIPEPM